MDLLNRLNTKQREAAEHIEGALLVLAGAGSGKTSMMTHRIAHMIVNKGVHSQSILAVTFTNKAAAEMKDRVEKLLGRSIHMWITTFHSACLRILRAHIEDIGYNKDFTIYDGTDQKTVIKQCLADENVDDKLFPIPYVLKVISESKDKGITAAKFEEQNASDFKGRKLAALYTRYEKTLKKNNAVDFDDLIMRTVQLFQTKPEILAEYQEKCKYIRVDEYQDTNQMQYKFVSMLAQKHGNICVVGDDDQCIYEWRGANIRNILGFEKDFKNTTVIKLEQNYRSTSTILEAAHSVIKNNHGRKAKKLWTENEDGEKIKYFRANTERDEALFIANEIDRLKSKELMYSDFAILYRTHAQSRAMEEVLSAKEIPYRVLGGTRFYDRKEIKDVMSYLRLIQNLADDISLKRIINEPKRGLGDKTLEKLETLADVRNESLFSVMCDTEVIEGLSTKAAKGVSDFVQTIYKYAMEKETVKVSDIYDGILIETGYLKALEEQNTVESTGRIENLLEFKSVIYDYENETEGLFLTEFMERISLMTDIDNHDADENAVVMMTLHSAKGLEFPVVFIPGMEDGLFPGRRAFDTPDGIEEERRLCYVGITRAKEKLYLTGADQRMLYGRTEYCKPSVFMKEIDKNLLDLEGVVSKTKPDFIQPKVEEGVKFNPFDQLRYIKKQNDTKAAPATTGTSDIRDGDKVKHHKFGEGMIVSVKGDTVTVVFDNFGLKQLALDFANLEKI